MAYFVDTTPDEQGGGCCLFSVEKNENQFCSMRQSLNHNVKGGKFSLKKRERKSTTKLEGEQIVARNNEGHCESGRLVGEKQTKAYNTPQDTNWVEQKKGAPVKQEYRMNCASPSSNQKKPSVPFANEGSKYPVFSVREPQTRIFSSPTDDKHHHHSPYYQQIPFSPHPPKPHKPNAASYLFTNQHFLSPVESVTQPRPSFSNQDCRPIKYYSSSKQPILLMKQSKVTPVLLFQNKQTQNTEEKYTESVIQKKKLQIQQSINVTYNPMEREAQTQKKISIDVIISENQKSTKQIETNQQEIQETIKTGFLGLDENGLRRTVKQRVDLFALKTSVMSYFQESNNPYSERMQKSQIIVNYFNPPEQKLLQYRRILDSSKNSQ